jgi:adenylate cyclase
MPSKEENLFQSMSRFLESDIEPASMHRELWQRYGDTVAVLVMDSSGFSRVTESHGIIHFLSRLMLLRDITQPLFNTHGAKQLRFEADNAFAVFDNVDDAITAALALHEKIYASRLMLTEEERFSVSIGIGYGEMLFSETLEGYFSEEMNFASKLGEDLGEGNETLITNAAWQNAERNLVKAFTPAETAVSGVSLKHYRHRFVPRT